MICQHPISTLFPYTTLFRSNVRELEHTLERAVLMCRSNEIKPADLGDRKSTRLNSSHVRISYAVFCLKKKRSDGARSLQESQVHRDWRQARSCIALGRSQLV